MEAQEADPEFVYDITRSQAFGPNRRYIREEIELVLRDLRKAYSCSSQPSREAISAAAGRLNTIKRRFDR